VNIVPLFGESFEEEREITISFFGEGWVGSALLVLINEKTVAIE